MSESQERRLYPRLDLLCPIELRSGARLLASTQTVHLSDGGALVMVPAENAPRIGDVLQISLRVPTSHTEPGEMREFSCNARVARRHNSTRPAYDAIAVEFLQPLELGLTH